MLTTIIIKYHIWTKEKRKKEKLKKKTYYVKLSRAFYTKLWTSVSVCVCAYL